MDRTEQSINYTGCADGLLQPFLFSDDPNQTTPDCPPDNDVTYIDPPYFSEARTAVLVTYLIILIIGSVGNGLVIYVICRHPEVRRKSVANYYILNLAVADFFFVLTLVFFCYATFTGDWVFGWVICKLAYAIRESNRYVSVFTLVALAFDRYLASFYSAGEWRTLLVGKLVCGAIWLCFVALTIPYWIYCDVVPGRQGRQSCRLPVDGVTLRKALSWVQFVAGFLVPFFLIIAAYSALGVRLHRLLVAGTKTGVKRPGKALTRMTLVITVTFLVTHLPYYVTLFLGVAKMEAVRAQSSGTGVTGRYEGVTNVSLVQSHLNSSEARRHVIFNSVATILVFVCSCCNPIIYGFLNQNYRKLYADVFCFFRCRPEVADVATGSSDSGATNGGPTNRGRQKRQTSVTGVTSDDAVELARII